MKQLESNSREVLVDPRPLFASTWMALFTELRKNYIERHPIGPLDTKSLQDNDSKQPVGNVN
jgi:hypothetical protein